MSDVSETSVNRWTPEMDAAVSEGFKEGLSARLIGEKLGVTRNAVLGRTFRLGICKPRSALRKTKANPVGRQTTLVHVAMRERLSPEQLIERIIDMRDCGHTWHDISVDLNVSHAVIFKWATTLGGYIPATQNRHTDEELAYIKEAWLRHDPLEQIADHLGRSWGVIRQTILRLQRKKILDTRDPNKTRLLRQYGEAALSAGATPAEALKKMAEAKRAAFAAAINASREAKRKFNGLAIETMLANIAASGDRDQAIFEARASGVTLEQIASHFDITRERVRQICNAHAQLIALKGLMA